MFFYYFHKIIILYIMWSNTPGSSLVTCFKGVSLTQRSTRLAHLLLTCWSILCQIIVQDWPNLCWGGFNSVKVDSIILYKLRYYSIYATIDTTEIYESDASLFSVYSIEIIGLFRAGLLDRIREGIA